MRTCIIDAKSLKVINVVDLGVQSPSPNIVENTHAPAGQLFVASETAQIGDSYDPVATVFTAAPKPVVAPSPPDVALEQALATGIRIVSKSAPQLNGTYAISPAQRAIITGIVAGIAADAHLPGGEQTFDYPESDGVTTHAFTGTQFIAMARAIEDFVYEVSRGGVPVQPVTIA